MCNIAGYVGTKPAAPILIDMLRREEGFGGGYYTGIATIHEGKLHYAKLTGDVQRLVDLTEAASLPGTVGIIHGRSNSGGGDEWAHPFIGMRDGVPVQAYAGNGITGCFGARTEQASALADSFRREGHQLALRYDLQSDLYPTLSDGGVAHVSDLMCQLILRNISGGADTVTARTEAFFEMPAEVTGLLLSLSAPECITWSRISQPMFVSYASHGAYMGTTSIAFPDDAGEAQLVPACSAGQVFWDHMRTVPFPTPPGKVARMDAEVRRKGYDLICERLRGGAMNLLELLEGINFPFEAADCAPEGALAYDILQGLHARGMLGLEQRRVPGAREDLDAPQLWLSINPSRLV